LEVDFPPEKKAEDSYDLETTGEIFQNTMWKTGFGNGRRSPLVMSNAPITDLVLQISWER
jgi:hypothetical protein